MPPKEKSLFFQEKEKEYVEQAQWIKSICDKFETDESVKKSKICILDRKYGLHFFRILIFREKRKIVSHFSRKTKKNQMCKAHFKSNVDF